MGRWTGLGVAFLAVGIGTLAAFEAPSGPSDQDNPLYLLAWVALLVGFACLVWGLAKEGNQEPSPPLSGSARTVSSSQQGTNNVQAAAGQDAVIGDNNILAGGDVYLTEPVAPRDDRIEVKVSPEQITALYEDKMTVEADQLLKRFKDHWMKIEGRVGNISDHKHSTTIQIGSLADPPVLWLRFKDSRERQRAMVHRKGQVIRVLGRIDDASSTNLHLEDCEVLD